MQENGIMTLAEFKIKEMSPEAASAIEMHNNIISAMNAAATAMVTLCENLKRMRDTQSYRAIGFERFEDYTERACGIKKRQAYNYIQTFERLGSTVLKANANLGITKLQLLTEVTATDRADFIEQNDIETISVAEMKKLVEKTKEQAEQIDLLQLTAKSDSETIRQLTKENEELKSRPTEVAVAEPSQADIKAAAAELTKELEAKHLAEITELKKAQNKKIREAKEKAVKAAAEEKEKAVKEAAEKAKAEALNEYKSKLDALETEKAEALAHAKKMAAKLDKNADADLVKASTYFTEAQTQLNKFMELCEKIGSETPENGSKLKAAAKRFLTAYFEKLQ